MDIKYIKTANLFGRYNHTIRFQDGVNIIIGDNGVGKTVCLKILNSIFNGDFGYLFNLEFESIIISYGREIWTISRLKIREQSEISLYEDSHAVIKVKINYVSSKRYPEELRMVRYWDEEQNREFVFLTNAMSLSALEIANLYRNRWQVELFFKWLKQHLKIKKFWGTTENAVKIQVYAAMTAYCLVAIAQQKLKLEVSTYEMLQKLSVTLTEKTPLRELFTKPKISNVKDQFADNGQLFINF